MGMVERVRVRHDIEAVVGWSQKVHRTMCEEGAERPTPEHTGDGTPPARRRRQLQEGPQMRTRCACFLHNVRCVLRVQLASHWPRSRA